MPLPNLRYLVAVARIDDGWNYSRIRERYGVSDGFIAKWSKVYRAHKTLKRTNPDLSRKDQILERFRSKSNRPKRISCPAQDRIMEAVVARRKKYGFEGADRIKGILGLRESTSTINKVMRRAGLMKKPKKRHHNLAYGPYERPLPNDLWHTDFKSWEFDFGTVHTTWIIDDASRYILAARITLRTSADLVIEMVQQAIDLYGLPKQLMTDHGTEYYAVSQGKGRSKLDRYCKDVGVEHIYSRVRHPQTNGKMERTHRSAKEETPYFGEIHSLEDARRVFIDWIEYHNTDCAHQALGYDVPINVYMAGSPVYEDVMAMAE
jgi:transposase InsO family protein